MTMLMNMPQLQKQTTLSIWKSSLLTMYLTGVSASGSFQASLLSTLHDHGICNYFGSGFAVIKFFLSLILYGKQQF